MTGLIKRNFHQTISVSLKSNPIAFLARSVTNSLFLVVFTLPKSTVPIRSALNRTPETNTGNLASPGLDHSMTALY